MGSYTWTVKHRYSEFHELHEKVRSLTALIGQSVPLQILADWPPFSVLTVWTSVQPVLSLDLEYLRHHKMIITVIILKMTVPFKKNLKLKLSLNA